MLQSRLVSVQNEVSMCFILYRIRPRGKAQSHIKAIWDAALRVGFLNLWLVNEVTDYKKKFPFFQKQDLKFGINSGKNVPYNHINRYFFQHIFRHKQGHELSGTLYPKLGRVPPPPSPGFKKYSGLSVYFLFFQSFIL